MVAAWAMTDDYYKPVMMAKDDGPTSVTQINWKGCVKRKKEISSRVPDSSAVACPPNDFFFKK